jgi:hypothetical protein
MALLLHPAALFGGGGHGVDRSCESCDGDEKRRYMSHVDLLNDARVNYGITA